MTRYISTIGVDYGVKPVLVDDVEVKVNFWDLSGHPEFFEVRNEFYKDAQGVRLRTHVASCARAHAYGVRASTSSRRCACRQALLVFDVSSRKTFECLEEWVAEARKFGGQGAVMFVVGNKVKPARRGGSACAAHTESQTDKERVVPEAEARAWAEARGFRYVARLPDG